LGGVDCAADSLVWALLMGLIIFWSPIWSSSE
jgi:hypothetical protein